MRLIDADALCELAQNSKDHSVDCNDIMRMPFIDAVPVVRCGECKHLDICERGTLYCLKTELIISSVDWYCAAGERREK